MKVWIVNQYAQPPRNAGGTRHHYLAKMLNELGYDVTILASPVSYISGIKTKEILGMEKIEGVKYLWLPSSEHHGNLARRLWGMMVYSAQVLRSKKRFQLPSPEVIIGSSPNLFAACAAERMAYKCGCYFILEIRDIWPQTLIEIGNISAYHPIVLWMRILERRCYRKARHIVSLLPNMVEYLKQRGISENKVTWIPNGVDISLFPLQVQAAAKEPFTVIYGGAHGIANALESLVKAAYLIKKWNKGIAIQIKLVGAGPQKLALIKQVTELNLTDIVRFEDPVPRSQFPEMLNTADVCYVGLRKSKLYQWGVSLNKLFDYMAAAKPVIFAGETVNNPVIIAGAGIVVPPEEPEALANAIIELSSIPQQELNKIGIRGRRYVEEHHELKKIGGRLAAVINQAAL